jgi:hypothetical protein
VASIADNRRSRVVARRFDSKQQHNAVRISAAGGARL